MPATARAQAWNRLGRPNALPSALRPRRVALWCRGRRGRRRGWRRGLNPAPADEDLPPRTGRIAVRTPIEDGAWLNARCWARSGPSAAVVEVVDPDLVGISLGVEVIRDAMYIHIAPCLHNRSNSIRWVNLKSYQARGEPRHWSDRCNIMAAGVPACSVRPWWVRNLARGSELFERGCSRGCIYGCCMLGTG